ncbi:MAG: type II secretion system protein [Candidatus Eiseniibacteriota bacterium]|nr:MAG: type II secretion system protein [Candidatus Eisenbacteria bacterium]
MRSCRHEPPFCGAWKKRRTEAAASAPRGQVGSLDHGVDVPAVRQASGFTLVELAVVLIVLGVLAAIAIPNYMSMTRKAKESTVKRNCHNVQLAVELFATGTNGVYPDANDGAIVANIVPELPGAQRLRNPFTNLRTEPVAGAAAAIGQTGYQVTNLLGVNVSYTITGFGQTALVLTQSGGQ